MALSVENNNFIEKLKSEFGDPESVPPYGECIVIPHRKFEPSWGKELAQMGIHHNFSSLRGESVVLVRLSKPLPPGKTPYVYIPPPPLPKIDNGNSVVIDNGAATSKHIGHPSAWTKEEDEELISLWNERPMLTVKEIADKLQKNGTVVQNHITILQKKKVIKTRFTIADKVHKEVIKTERSWSDKEEALLASLWMQQPMLTVNQITQQFVKQYPKRNFNSLTNHIHRMQVKGLLKRRLNMPNSKKEKPPAFYDKKPPAIFEAGSLLPKTVEHDAAQHDATQHSTITETEKVAQSILKRVEQLEVDLAVIRGQIPVIIQSEELLKIQITTLTAITDNILKIQINCSKIENEILMKKLKDHKHATSGEAMLPIE